MVEKHVELSRCCSNRDFPPALVYFLSCRRHTRNAFHFPEAHFCGPLLLVNRSAFIRTDQRTFAARTRPAGKRSEEDIVGDVAQIVVGKLGFAVGLAGVWVSWRNEGSLHGGEPLESRGTAANFADNWENCFEYANRSSHNRDRCRAHVG
jgi:hypothetical protein